MNVKAAVDVSTAPLAALGLVGGYLVARESGIRPLGGVLLGAWPAVAVSAGASYALCDSQPAGARAR